MGVRAGITRVLWLTAALAIAGCGGGGYSGAPQGSGSGGTAGEGAVESARFSTTTDFFQARIAPRMNFCRTCHVPGGIADTADGKRFMLSADASEDYENVKAAWQAMGGGVADSRFFIMNAEGGESHPGGANWPVGSSGYQDMVTLLQCWTNPDHCELQAAGGEPGKQWPLLGSSHARHAWDAFCANKPDNALLPVDPRTLVRPGVNASKAVYFNAYWQECHAALPEYEHPKTCGEFRVLARKGYRFLLDVLPSQSIRTMSVAEYNTAWKQWGFDHRPENFDTLFRVRYGYSPAPFDNPYPRPGEDPNKTNGGSGQLPLGLRQIKSDQGDWTGQIGIASCFACHGGTILKPNGEPLTTLGLGNSNYDAPMRAQNQAFFADTPLGKIMPIKLSFLLVENIGIDQRGLNNAVGAFELLVTLLDLDTLQFNPNPTKTMVGSTGLTDIAHPLSHPQDTPAWWNVSHRPRKFFDAGLSNDSTRILLAAAPNQILSAGGKSYRQNIAEYAQAVNVWLLTLESPKYPGNIDKELARQGAVIFHNLDLWSRPGNASAPKPLGGNGSCASCHGAYSPRYVHDASFLEDPRLEGMAAHLVPLAVIGTDPARSNMLTPTLRERWDTTYWAFPEGSDNYIPLSQKNPVREMADDMFPTNQRPSGACGWEKSVIGYQAPPLYGVWATAPYLHNGSVPTVAAVLEPSLRPHIWQRKLREGPNGLVKGFDLRMSKAYDFKHLGWKYTEMTCAEMPGFLNCNPVNKNAPSLPELVENLLNKSISWTGLLPITDLEPKGLEKRLIYDTRDLGNGNEGHDFSTVLTQQERRAVIEYLKTL